MKLANAKFVIALLLLFVGALLPAQQLSNSKLSIHLINGYTAGSSNVVSGHPQLLKVLGVDPNFPSGEVQAMRDFKTKSPGGKVIVRVYSPKTYWTNDDPTLSAGDFWTNHMLPALNQLSASDKQLIDYLEGPNEGETPTLGYPNDSSLPAHFSSQWFNQFWTNLTPMMVLAGYKPCIGSIAVGNPGDFGDLDYFVPALRQAKAAGGAWSYHSYTIDYTTDVADEIWYSLRYRQFYNYFTQNFSDLATMPLILTEGGVDYSGTPATSGWQARGSSANYERWLNWFDYQMQQDSYLIGCTLFQNGDPSGWASFDLETVMAGAQPGVVPIIGWMKNYLQNPANPPSAPTGLTATASTSVLLTWTNVAVNPTTFNVKRATNNGGPYTLIARNVTEGVVSTTYTDTSAANNGTTYYYVVSAANAAGEGPNSTEVSTLPGLPKINCGGAATGGFLADAFYDTGQASSTNGAVDVSGVSNPAPMAVYQTQRYGSLTYNLPNLWSGSYKVRLHFAEIYWGAAGQRVFNVFINGAKVLNNFDIFVAAGGAGKANIQEFNAVPDANGNIAIRLATVVNNAAINGIEVLTNSTSLIPAPPTGLTANVGSGNVTLNWLAPAGVTSFSVKRATVSGGPYLVRSTNQVSSTFVDTSYASGSTYYYVVTALNGAGESGNSAQVTATPTNGLPDAVGTALTWVNTSIVPGNSVFFKITVKNQGLATIAANSLGVGFLVDGTQVSYVGAGNPALGIGSSVTYTANGGGVSGAWIATPGVHTVTAVIDDLNRFAEGDENNNLFSVPLTVYVPSYAVNSGGSASGIFAADSNYSGSANTYSVANSIDVAGVSNAAPQAIYQSERWGNTIYTFSNLTPGNLYKARLHFAEISPSVTQAGDRQFNVVINGVRVLNDFDILAVAGAKFRAVTKQFNIVADGLGGATVSLTRGSGNEPKIGGLEIFPYTNTSPVLASIPTKTVNAGATLIFTNTAIDADLPADTLTFSLTNSPAGATIGSGTGVFTWTAPLIAVNQTNFATAVVTDNGSPSLNNSKTFSIVIVAPPKLVSVTATNGNVNLQWSSYPSKTYQVQFKADLNDPTWTNLGSPATAVGNTLSTSDVAPVDQQRFYRIIQTN